MDEHVDKPDLSLQIRLALSRWENEGGAGSAASVRAGRALRLDRTQGAAAERRQRAGDARAPDPASRRRPPAVVTPNGMPT